MPSGRGGAVIGGKLKSSLSGAASAVGAAAILSAVFFAGPAEAASACWDSGYGRQCRDFGESDTGRVKVLVVDQPSFTGILRSGQTLSSYPGEWQGARTLKFQWLRDGLAIPGAVGETYEIPASDAGRSLALRVTASADGLKDGVETTLPSPKVSDTNADEYTARPGITGEAPYVTGSSRVGFTLAAQNLGTWSPSQLTLKLQWQADGADIAGATGDTYTIKPADLGKKVTLKATGSSPGPGLASVSTSNIAPAVTGGYIVVPAEMGLQGGSAIGDTLTVGVNGGWYAGGEPVSLHYRWMRDGQLIIGATGSTYTIVAADKGSQIHAEITATASGYGPNTQTTIYTVVDGDSDGDPDSDGDGDTAGDGGLTSGEETAPVLIPAPAPAVVDQEPVNRPAAQIVLARTDVPVQTGRKPVQVQSAGPAQALATDTGSAAVVDAAPAEAASAEPAPASPATGPDTTAATPTAAASPVPSSAPGQAVGTAPASSKNGFDSLPLALTLVGLLIAGGLVGFIRPIRAALTRLVARKTK